MVVSRMMLRSEGYVLTIPQQEKVDFALSVAKYEKEFEEIKTS
jgi:prophage maintenance system killer protein